MKQQYLFLKIYTERLIERAKVTADIGLWSGKMGTAIYLLHLARITQNEECENCASQFIEKVSYRLSYENLFFYADGLLSIVCGLEYIIANGSVKVIANGSVKGVSKGCQNKNIKLLPFTAYFLACQRLIKNAVVISDCSKLLDFEKFFEFSLFFEKRETGQDELISCYNYIRHTKYLEFVLLPITQPFREKDLIQRCLSLYDQRKDVADFVASFNEIPKRERFYLLFNQNIPKFKNENITRKDELCDVISMIDGSIYVIKTSFITNVALSENPNSLFWNGNFQCVKNNVPFIDIDTVEDMDKFDFLNVYFKNNLR